MVADWEAAVDSDRSPVVGSTGVWGHNGGGTQKGEGSGLWGSTRVGSRRVWSSRPPGGSGPADCPLGGTGDPWRGTRGSTGSCSCTADHRTGR